MICSGSAGKGTPTASSGMPMRPLPSAMIRRSQQAARMHPPAMAWPFTAATSGLGNVKASRNIRSSTGKKRRP